MVFKDSGAQNQANPLFFILSVNEMLKNQWFSLLSIPETAYVVCSTMKNCFFMEILVFLIFFIISRTFSRLQDTPSRSTSEEGEEEVGKRKEGGGRRKKGGGRKEEGRGRKE